MKLPRQVDDAHGLTTSDTLADAAITATGLVACSSLDYIANAFRLYKKRRPFVSVSSPSAAALLAGIRIDAIIEPTEATGWFDASHPVQYGADAAQVSFTSGTTGAPKGIVLSHDALADTTQRLIDVQELDDTVREYVAVPPNYSFGLGRYRAVAAVGGQSFMSARGFDPAEIGRMLRDGEINALAAVPTMLRVLIDHANLIGDAGQQMRWIEIGSQHMTRVEKERVKAIFPRARIVQHFGLTEASRTTFLDISNTVGARLDSVGQPVGATEVRLAPDGRVCIRGPHVAREWIGADGISPLVDEAGWLTTNDLGEMHDDFLVFRGRADDLINFGGIKLVPDLIEDRLRAQLGTAPRIAVARIADPQRGDGVLVATDDADASVDALRRTALSVLTTFGVAGGNGLHVAVVDEIPTTATGKIQRRALAAMAAADPCFTQVETAADDQPASDVLRAFRLAFPRPAIRGSDSFIELGGDLLAHVSIMFRLDEPSGRLPSGWESRSITELETLLAAAPQVTPSSRMWRSTSSDIVLRAAAIILIVAHHVLQIDLGGGIDVLLLLVGVNLARFQTGRLASPQRWSLVADIMLRMVLPYYFVLAILERFYHQAILAPDILLVSNFVGRFHDATVIYWFVEGYLQTVLLLAILAAVPPVRRMIAGQPGRFGAMLLIAAVVIKFASLLTFHHEALLGRTPDQFLYIVALGWCVQEARTRSSRAALLLFTLVIMLLDLSGIAGLWSGFDGRWHTAALFVATGILLYVPVIKLPHLVRLAAISVATASLMIYLTHPMLLPILEPFFWRRLLGYPHTTGISLCLLMFVLLGSAISLNHLLAVTLRYAPRVQIPARVFNFGRSR